MLHSRLTYSNQVTTFSTVLSFTRNKTKATWLRKPQVLLKPQVWRIGKSVYLSLPWRLNDRSAKVPSSWIQETVWRRRVTWRPFLVLWLMINRHAFFCNGSAALKRFLVPHWEIAWRRSTFLAFKLSLKRLLARYHDAIVELELLFYSSNFR